MSRETQNENGEKRPPRERDRDKRQPYTREVEEYSGDVVKPPERKTGRTEDDKRERPE